MLSTICKISFPITDVWIDFKYWRKKGATIDIDLWVDATFGSIGNYTTAQNNWHLLQIIKRYCKSNVKFIYHDKQYFIPYTYSYTYNFSDYMYIQANDELTVVVEGEDEKKTYEAITDIITNSSGEIIAFLQKWFLSYFNLDEQNLVKSVPVCNRRGLHAVPASRIVNTTMCFESEVYLFNENGFANARSIMDVMVLAAAYDTTVDIVAFGSDYKNALEAIKLQFISKFDEV
jgi:phosphocarrier protein HPr